MLHRLRDEVGRNRHRVAETADREERGDHRTRDDGDAQDAAWTQCGRTFDPPAFRQGLRERLDELGRCFAPREPQQLIDGLPLPGHCPQRPRARGLRGVSGRFLEPGGQDGQYPSLSALQTRFDGGRAHPELLADLAWREVGSVAQRDELAVERAQ